MEKSWIKSALKAEWITLLFIVLCTIGFLFKDSIPHNFFTASFMHASRSHYTGNIMLFLLLSPLVEEKYGKINYLCAWFFTTIVEYSFHTYILHVNAIGISVWIFALMCMNIGRLKITGIILIGIYSIQEISGMFDNDTVSHAGHMLGIVTGSLYAFIYNKICSKMENYHEEDETSEFQI